MIFIIGLLTPMVFQLLCGDHFYC